MWMLPVGTECSLEGKGDTSKQDAVGGYQEEGAMGPLRKIRGSVVQGWRVGRLQECQPRLAASLLNYVIK